MINDKKPKIKRKTKPVSVYLTDEQHKELIEATNEKNISITDWMFDAMQMKLRHDSNDLNKEADRLIDYWSKRIEELKNEESVLKKDRHYKNWINGKFNYK